eukprot:scaffold10038_cov267-Chaetoceros_neogracile.AAC.13
MTSRVHDVNPNAEIVSKAAARAVNVAAASGLQGVLKSNLGPRGTLKMLVGGAGQIKLTKDGNVLLHEMQIQHPTAAMIARTATAQDDVTGDGTTTTVLMCGELLRQAERYTSEGLHPRAVTDGYDIARDAALEFLDSFKVPIKNDSSLGAKYDRELMTCIASTSLRTKLDHELADGITEAIVDAILCVAPEDDKPVDLNMIEVMAMMKKMGTDSRFVNGLVLDHGGRHPDMPKVNAEEREKLVESERKWLDERCKAVIDFKKAVCKEGESFVMINQKGIDALCLDIFAKEGILCLRRAKRRNMERMTLACGGSPIHSIEDMDESQLGFAGKVSEVTLGEDKFTFVEECRTPKSCTLLLQGPNAHTVAQIKDAVRDGLRAVKNAIEDKAVVPGGGAFEIAASMHLRDVIAKKTRGRVKLGVQAYAEALLVVPKTLAENSGFDVQDTIIKLSDEREATGLAVGLDCSSGEVMIPADEGVWDNVRVKRQCLYLSTVLANQLLLVDEVMKAGKQMGKNPAHNDNPNDPMSGMPSM